jgi:hypothetical protein
MVTYGWKIEKFKFFTVNSFIPLDVCAATLVVVGTFERETVFLFVVLLNLKKKQITSNDE